MVFYNVETLHGQKLIIPSFCVKKVNSNLTSTRETHSLDLAQCFNGDSYSAKKKIISWTSKSVFLKTGLFVG